MVNASFVLADLLSAELVVAKAPCCQARSVHPPCGWTRGRDVQRMAARRCPGRLLKTVACQRESAADSEPAEPQPVVVTDGSAEGSSSAPHGSEDLPVAALDADELWGRLSLLNRQMQLAAREEDYSLASRLRDQMTPLTAQLHPMRQYLWGRVQALHGASSKQERLDAIVALGDAGDDLIVPELAQYLASPGLQAATEQAMWAIFHRTPNPSVSELMNQGCRLMTHAPQLVAAKELFDAITKMDPSFAEGWNKKATVEYVLHEFEESLEDCQRAIELQPFHWGALAGRVLCYIKMQKFPEALEACQATLAVHPGCEAIAQYQRLLRRAIDVDGSGGANIGGDFR